MFSVFCVSSALRRWTVEYEIQTGPHLTRWPGIRPSLVFTVDNEDVLVFSPALLGGAGRGRSEANFYMLVII